MDAFQILSRSTNRSGRGKKQSTLSNNPSVEPARHAPSTTNLKQEIPQTKKRKRSSQTPQHPTIAQDVDFFNRRRTFSEPAESLAERNDVARLKPNANNMGESIVKVATEQNEQLDEHQCREILRANKIKITHLQRSTSATGTKKSSKEASNIPPKLNKRKHDVTIRPLQSFDQLNSEYAVSPRIVQNLALQGFTKPTEVQLAGLPLLLGHFDTPNVGKSVQSSGVDSSIFKTSAAGIDLLTVAPTGSGKTLAFLIPILEAVYRYQRAENSEHPTKNSRHAPSPLAVIVAPTKELAHQIVNEARKLAMHTGVKISLVRKGMKLNSASDTVDTEIINGESNSQTEAFVKSGILVSTPLSLIHAMQGEEKLTKALSTVRHLVLDEADVLLDPLFQQQTMQILDVCSNPDLRLSFWSATMGSSIEDLVKLILDKRQASLEVDHEGIPPPRAPLLRLVVGLKDSAVATVHHKLIYAATEQGKLMALRQLLRPSEKSDDSGPPLIPPFLVFTQTISRAIALHSELLYDIPREAGGESRLAVLHADLSEASRDRIMNRFRLGEIWMLITTDLLSRGVDFHGINGVVNYDFPNSSAAYVHRVGRTGRAGRRGGVAITLYAKEDVPYVKTIANVIAASEKQQIANDHKEDTGQWILRSLPNPTKNAKKTLKKRGVESRRTVASVDLRRHSGKGRISTKSGYERSLEHKRRGAIRKNKNATTSPINSDSGEDADSNFGGFSD